jgi:hypothetical protein
LWIFVDKLLHIYDTLDDSRIKGPILIKLFLNSKDLIRTVKFVKQLFRIQIKKGKKVLLWNQVKSRMEACYSEFILEQAR